MLGRTAGIWHPDRYHGRGKKDGFFEGWYFKVVDPTERHIYAFIPGISFAAEDSHSFIQVLNGASGESRYFRYGLGDFRASKTRFEVEIGGSAFANDTVRIDIPGEYRGELKFLGVRPWPVSLFSPGVMGPYAFAPFMECYHGVLSLDHGIQGRMSVGTGEMDFTGGRGYIEKDWGRAFPSSWVWMQSNHFSEPGFSLSLSLARVPWRRSWFPGLIAGLLVRDRLYRFATYTGAKLTRLDVSETSVVLEIRDAKHRLEVEAARTAGGELVSPRPRAGMTGRIGETMSSVVRVALRRGEKFGGALVFEGEGRNAGLEVVGNVSELRPEAPRGGR